LLADRHGVQIDNAMKTKKTTKRRTAEAAAGAVIGAVIGGPVGAVAGGLAANHADSDSDLAGNDKKSRQRNRADAEDPLIHAQVKRILVPLDFSPPSKRAMRFAKEWAKKFGAEIHLLHVLEPTTVVMEFGTVPLGTIQQDLAGRAKAALEELARTQFPDSVRVRAAVRKGPAYDQISAVAEEIHADLIIIATHGHTGLKHTLLGSTAERVVRHAPCPVLTLRRATSKGR